MANRRFLANRLKRNILVSTICIPDVIHYLSETRDSARFQKSASEAGQDASKDEKKLTEKHKQFV
ncbi:hypothetical protein T265_02147 [Opisthorchis viverrini]|uniref:Uncharacterized protein n=1 Tax=Opisthorchis viverrini TaxID=6198 RepID=A0A075A052_OPIVI|nr:hypothetical protein T265_02147 [Opisthorchis viverrini]KER31637.1 hypothetical protein T265_02147 [Opisthorchis viverrini]